MPPLVPGTLSPPSAPVDNSTQQIYNETITLETGASTPCDNASISCIHCSYAELIISGFKAPALDIMLAEAGSQLKLTHNIGHQGAARSPIISTGGPPSSAHLTSSRANGFVVIIRQGCGRMVSHRPPRPTARLFTQLCLNLT